MPKPLDGRTIALAESRELNLLAEMMESQGARTIRCPMVGILDVPDPAPVLDWLRRLVAGEMDDVVLLTGEGLRRLLGFAERAEMRDSVVSALGRVRKITRGPKPARALRQIGLGPDLAAERPTTDGVIATLSSQDLSDRSVGVQLYAQVPNEKLQQFLEGAGATVHLVAPYVYAPASDARQVLSLIRSLEAGEVDVIAFTSASQVERLWEVAGEHGVQAVLEAGMGRTRVAAVGPIVAEELAERGVTVQITPASSYFMRPMLHEIIRALEGKAE